MKIFNRTDEINKYPLHKTTVAGVIEALEISFGKNMYADKVVEKLLRQNKRWGSRDRAFVAANTYEMVRYWRLLWFLYGREPSLKRKDLSNLFGLWWMLNGNELPDWPKFDHIRNFDWQKAWQNLPPNTGIRESFPEWLNEIAQAELGNDWPALAYALNERASVVLRTNTLKTNREQLLVRLKNENIEAEEMPEFPLAIKLCKRPKLTHLQSFKEGWFEVHDAGSQTIAPFLKAKPGELVIDACAGAGGKTLQLAALMQNRGQIIAMDVEPYKLSELEKRAERNGVDIVHTSLIEGHKSIDKYAMQADRLLLDVPCSGTGVIRRDVDTKWKLQPEHIERTIAIQREILSRYTQMLKSRGTLVYATCSILKRENEDQKDWFLQEFGDEFTFEEEARLHPGSDNDGFYMARFIKK